MYQVNLVYRTDRGKYYSECSYESGLIHMFEIVDEVQTMLDSGQLPGLSGASCNYFVTINVPDHPNDHPCMCIPKFIRVFVEASAI